MERGTISSYDRGNGQGVIRRGQNPDVRFRADNIIGRDRVNLK